MSGDLSARLAAIKARCEAATPGPWVQDVIACKSAEALTRLLASYAKTREGLDLHVVRSPGHPGNAEASGSTPKITVTACHTGNGPNSPTNAEFIANAREDVPFLLEQLEAAEERALNAHGEHGRTRAKLAASEAEAARLRKLFDDAGQGEHNVLALVEHCQREALASEAAAGQLRAALKLAYDMLRFSGPAVMTDAAEWEQDSVTTREFAEVALSADAGHGWKSPEETERLIRQAVQVALIEQQGQHAEEAERLRKELHLVRTHTGALTVNGISEEECARRCREVAEEYAEAVLRAVGEVGHHIKMPHAELPSIIHRAKSLPRGRLEEGESFDLYPVERVKKGGAR